MLSAVEAGGGEQAGPRKEILRGRDVAAVVFAKLPPLALIEPAAQAAELAVLHVLVVDDDQSMREICYGIAAEMGCAAMQAESVVGARAILKFEKIDLLLLNLRLPGGGSLSLLDEVKANYPETGVVVLTAFATVASAVEAMRMGASDYLTKPFAAEDLRAVIEGARKHMRFNQESRMLRERLRSNLGVGDMVGQSPEMEKLYRILSKVAFSTHPVLILGEGGTGKDLVARAIHHNGTNALKPFASVDCGSMVPGLIENELFGHVKGAYPGVGKAQEGLLAAVAGGTVLLNEIGELSLELQAKLLRALQEKQVHPLGGTQSVPISARVLATTNRDLGTMVEHGLFRKDLFFRLSVVSLKLPPLRERKQDIHVLALHFLERIERKTGTAWSFSDEAMEVILDYEWPGNVRELGDAIRRACAMSSGPVLFLGDLPSPLQEFRMQRALALRGPEVDEKTLDGVMAGTISLTPGTGEARGGIVSIAAMEKRAILGTILKLKGDKLMAAKLLGIGKTTLYRKLKEYGITEVADAMH